MRIVRIVIDEIAEEHIARHGVRPAEVQEVASRNPLVRSGPGRRRRRTLYLYGRTSAGRFLFVVLGHRTQGTATLITARPMDEAERRLFLRSRR